MHTLIVLTILVFSGRVFTHGVCDYWISSTYNLVPIPASTVYMLSVFLCICSVYVCVCVCVCVHVHVHVHAYMYVCLSPCTTAHN